MSKNPDVTARALDASSDLIELLWLAHGVRAPALPLQDRL